MNRRNTIQKDIVLNAVQTLKNHATAEEIYAFVIKQHPTISKGTIYRNLNILSQEGLIKHIELPNGADRYDHQCMKHFHVRCIYCDKIFDVEVDNLPDITQFVQGAKDIQFLDYDIIFKGICHHCRGELNHDK